MVGAFLNSTWTELPIGQGDTLDSNFDVLGIEFRTWEADKDMTSLRLFNIAFNLRFTCCKNRTQKQCSGNRIEIV